MPEQSIVCEQVKLVPSITVDIHPTIETTPPAKEKEADTTQNDVEKSLGLKITGGVDFKMPITIFHASASIVSCVSTATVFFRPVFRSRMARKQTKSASSLATQLFRSKIKTLAR